jgi:NADP-dependent 3-hydroxy acid dehydrogenase YdfG
MDPVAARRTQAGAQVVHGIHAVLWALEATLANGRSFNRITTLDVQFKKFIYVGDQVALASVRETETMLRVALCVDGLETTTLEIGFAPRAKISASLLSTAVIEVPQVPLTLTLADLPGRSGRLSITNERRVSSMFLKTTEQLGKHRVEAIAQLSTLVGMVCPGLHSIFSSLELEFTSEPEEATGLNFKVQNIDGRFRLAKIAISGSGLRGMASAFVRHPPVTQPSYLDLTQLVHKNEFSSTTALIVGGSRGLGALTARAIAAGGGRVIVTYVHGETEALDISKEIGPDACCILRYDVRKDASEQLSSLDWNVNQLYYFATSQIFRQKASWFVSSHFSEFCQMYVTGFEAVCKAVQIQENQKLSVFYPSSLAVEDHPRDMIEYSMAKAAGEILCSDMNRFMRDVHVVVKRLPRILTDQTATVMPVESSDPLDVMLPIIRELHVTASCS